MIPSSRELGVNPDLILTGAVTLHGGNIFLVMSSENGTLATSAEKKSSENDAVCQNMVPKGLDPST